MVPSGDHPGRQCPRLLPSGPWVTPRVLQAYRREPFAKIILLYPGLSLLLCSKSLGGPSWRIDWESPIHCSHSGWVPRGQGFNTRLAPRNQGGVPGGCQLGQRHPESPEARAQAPRCQHTRLEHPSCSNAWLKRASHSWAELEASATHSWFQLHFPCLVPIMSVGFQALMAELWLGMRTALGQRAANQVTIQRDLSGVTLYGLDPGLRTNFLKANKQKQNGKPWNAGGWTDAPLFRDRNQADWKFYLLVNFCLLHCVPWLLLSTEPVHQRLPSPSPLRTQAVGHGIFWNSSQGEAGLVHLRSLAR